MANFITFWKLNVTRFHFISNISNFILYIPKIILKLYLNSNTNNDLTDSSFTTTTVTTTTTTSNQANNIQCSSSSGVGNNSSLSTSSASSSASPSPNQQTSTTTPQPSPLNSQQQQVSFNIIDSFDDTCTITSALKHYLIHLKEPLMTYASNQQFLMACRKCHLEIC